MYNKQYKEHSTGDNFADSIAYGTEELGNPGVIHFYKQYRNHISLEMLRMYHHLHRYVSNLQIPNLQLDDPIEYEGKKYDTISFDILDLDPDAIYAASDRETGKQHRITQPEYIEGDEMSLFYIFIETRAKIKSYISDFLHQQGIYLRTTIDTSNIKITTNGNNLHVTIVDLGSYIQEICIDNIERINNQIPERHTHKIQTRKELNTTLLGHTDYTPIL